MMTRSLWSRIVIAQVAVALALALGLPVIVHQTINAVGDDLTQRFMSGEADQVMAMLDNPQAGEAMGGLHGGAVAFAGHVRMYRRREGPRAQARLHYLFFRYVFVSVHEDIGAARSLPRPERPGGRSFGMRPGLELPRPSGAAGRVV